MLSRRRDGIAQRGAMQPRRDPLEEQGMARTSTLQVMKEAKGCRGGDVTEMDFTYIVRASESTTTHDG